MPSLRRQRGATVSAAHHAAFRIPAAFRVHDRHQLPESSLVAPAQRSEGLIRRGRDLLVSAHHC